MPWRQHTFEVSTPAVVFIWLDTETKRERAEEMGERERKWKIGRMEKETEKTHLSTLC